MRTASRMTDARLKSLKKTAACGETPGFWCVVRKLKSGKLSKYFVLRVRFDDGSSRVLALGKYPQLSLADAFKKAAEWRVLVDKGIDPAEEEKKRRDALKPKKPEPEALTFEQLIRKWIAFEEGRGKWKNASKPRDYVWDGFFRNHIPEELRVCPVKDLTPEMFCDALEEKWRTMIDTPERILCDARRAIDWAIRQNLVPPMVNPCVVKDGKLGDLLPLDRPDGGHEPALPPKRMPAFFVELMKKVPVSQTARCLAFAILTAARNTTAREANGVRSSRTMKAGGCMSSPRARMKIKGEKIPFDRKTPLSKEALGLLETAPRVWKDDDDTYVFPNINKGETNEFSRDSVRMFIKRMHNKQKAIDGIGWVDPEQIDKKSGRPRIVTLHGCARATFNTWAKDATGYDHLYVPRDLRESCLDHRNESYQCAYDREQALGDMRKVFDAWGEFCLSLVCNAKEEQTP